MSRPYDDMAAKTWLRRHGCNDMATKRRHGYEDMTS
jgi:hypothetical protein